MANQAIQSTEEALQDRAPQPIDETLLVAGLKARDERCYEQLVRVYGRRMLAVARRLSRTEEEARDAVQEAFLAAFRAMPNFRQQSSLQTWLHRITVNAVLMNRRRKSAVADPDTRDIDDLLPSFDSEGHHRGPAPIVSPPCPNPERTLLGKERRLRVRRAINRLPDNYRTVVLLHEFEGMSTREIAFRLVTSPNAVRIRLHRARLALASRLAEDLLFATRPTVATP